MNNQWISVKDRLPDKYGDVLVFYSDRTHRVHYWQCQGFPAGVTHWRPLPEPPPPPDPFDVWTKAHEWAPYPNHIAITNDDNESLSTISKHCARKIWDAAIASIKP